MTSCHNMFSDARELPGYGKPYGGGEALLGAPQWARIGSASLEKKAPRCNFFKQTKTPLEWSRLRGDTFSMPLKLGGTLVAWQR